MTVKEFKNTRMCKEATKVNYHNINGKDMTNKPSSVLDKFHVIGSGHNADGSIDVDVIYVK